jgi:hypothetical protein
MILLMTASVVEWSEFLSTNAAVRVPFPALPEFLERCPLSLVSTIEELLERKSSGSGLETRIAVVGDPPR